MQRAQRLCASANRLQIPTERTVERGGAISGMNWLAIVLFQLGRVAPSSKAFVIVGVELRPSFIKRSTILGIMNVAQGPVRTANLAERICMNPFTEFKSQVEIRKPAAHMAAARSWS
jgi:hypothetical protein